MDMLSVSQELVWQNVPQRAVALAEKCAGITKDVRKAIADLPQEGFLDIWYNKEQDKLWLNVGDWMETDVCREWEAALRPLASEFAADAEIGKPSVGEGAWVKIAMRPWVARVFTEKRAESPTMDFMARHLGFKPGVIPTAPNPLVSGLATGLLGAGLGYGAGWLGEQLMPKRWEKGKLRRNLAIMGGLAGAAPSAIWALNNVDMGKHWNSGESMANTRIPDTADAHKPWTLNQETGDMDLNMNYWSPRSLHTMPELEQFAGKEVASAIRESFEKQAFMAQTGLNREWPPVNVPNFHAAVNFDPRVRNRLSPWERAAATTLAAGGSALEGGTKLVSPATIGRIAAGMGSGYLSGALVGGVLGALTGMPADTQERLKNTGMWAGAISNILPLAFGG